MSLPQSERNRLAQRLLLLRDECAAVLTDQIFAEGAACSRAFGEQGRDYCREDIGFHIQFLAAGVQAGSPPMFGSYLRWADRLVKSRGIGCEPSETTARRIVEYAGARLAEAERTYLVEFLAAGDEIEGKPAEVAENVLLARQAYLAALLAAERQAAVTVAHQCLRDGISLVDLYVEVLGEALHSVGRLWESNVITVAQEHLATAITQMVIATLYPRMARPGASLGRLMVTGVAGEMHQIGANLLADALDAEGWSVSFVGSNVPARSLVEMLARTTPDVLCVSVTLVSNLPAATELISKVRERFGAGAPRIIVGGSAFELAPEGFLDELGVTRTDLRGAVRLLCPETPSAAEVR